MRVLHVGDDYVGSGFAEEEPVPRARSSISWMATFAAAGRIRESSVRSRKLPKQGALPQCERSGPMIGKLRADIALEPERYEFRGRRALSV